MALAEFHLCGSSSSVFFPWLVDETHPCYLLRYHGSKHPSNLQGVCGILVAQLDKESAV